ncbi:hypothetical protein KBI23_09465 [bacterium]|nr:hypothetical protein [bacterium]MBP9810520.1 hypothetical protein [bacterium]
MVILQIIMAYWWLAIPLSLTVLIVCLTTLSIQRKQNRRKKYFFANLSAEQCQRLVSAGIDYETANVAGQSGVAVAFKYLQTTLKVLQAQVHTTLLESGVVYRVIFTIAPPDKQHVLESITFSGQFPLRQERLAEVVGNLLSPIVKQQIVVYGNSCALPKADDDSKFHLVLSTDYDQERWYTNVTDNVWSIPPRLALKARDPDAQALPYVDFSSGFSPCQLQGNRLDFLFDVLAANSKKIGWFTRLKRRLARQGEDYYLALLANCLSCFVREVLLEREIQAYISKEGGADFSGTAMTALGLDEVVPVNKIPVKISGFSDDVRQRRGQAVLIKLAQQVLGSFCRTQLTVINCRGSISAVTRVAADDDLIIKFCSAPMETRRVRMPNYYWNSKAPDQSSVFSPSPLGVPIVTAEGYAVGELVGRVLYVYSELIHSGTKDEALLWATFLLEARRLILQLSEPGASEAALEEMFAWECTRQFKLQEERSPPPVAQLNGDCEAFASSLRASIFSQRVMYEQMAAPWLGLGEEFDAIMAIPKILDVTVKDNQVIVTTKTLYCKDPRDNVNHEIGPFKIVIPASSSDGLRWYNQGTFSRPNGMNAPHVDAEGKACLGNMKEVFSQLLSARQYAAVVEAAIAFVEAVNTDDTWGKHIDRWPRANLIGDT